MKSPRFDFWYLRACLQWSKLVNFMKIHPYVNFAWQVLSAGLKVSRIQSFSFLFYDTDLCLLCLNRWSKRSKFEIGKSSILSRQWRKLTHLQCRWKNWRTTRGYKILSTKSWDKRLNVAISFRNIRDATSEVRGSLYLQRANSTTKYLSERTIAQPFAGVNDQITEFCAAFTALRKMFDSKLAVNTALVLSRAMTTVEAISEHLVH